MVRYDVKITGCKESQFYSLQAVTNIYWPESQFYLPKRVFSQAEKKELFYSRRCHTVEFQSTATREWLTCILEEKKNGVETVKPKFSMDTLNDNVGNAKSCRWKRFILQFAANKNSPPEYFLKANKGDIYIIRGDKILIAFICLLLIQKKCIQKIIFLKKVCLGVGFPSQVSSSRESGKCKGRVMRQWTYYVNKNYANLWFILLEATKC